MVEYFLEEGTQAKINAVSLDVAKDGETLEKSLECPRESKK